MVEKPPNYNNVVIFMRALITISYSLPLIPRLVSYHSFRYVYKVLLNFAIG